MRYLLWIVVWWGCVTALLVAALYCLWQALPRNDARFDPNEDDYESVDLYGHPYDWWDEL